MNKLVTDYTGIEPRIHTHTHTHTTHTHLHITHTTHHPHHACTHPCAPHVLFPRTAATLVSVGIAPNHPPPYTCTMWNDTVIQKVIPQIYILWSVMMETAIQWNPSNVSLETDDVQPRC